jgi:NAD(P) transhydrogenase subunit alpha
VVQKCVADGFDVLVEPGAGEGAFIPDAAYVAAGATLADAATLLASVDVLLTVNRPGEEAVRHLRPPAVVVGLLGARSDPDAVRALAGRGLRPLSLDLLPRTVSRAQTMDALSSQASIAGYRAAVLAAAAYPRFFPMMITAAGTARPASVLVLGAGVAGLQAIGTARRLGAQVSAYDVRPAAADEIASLGATPLTLSVGAAAGEGGYARALTADETALQQAELAEHVRRFDVVITTAAVPGMAPPLLVTAETVAAMRPGSVLVDLAAGPLGGNVAGSVPGETVDIGGVLVIGAGDLPSDMPAAASAAYARNVAAVLRAIVVDGAVHLDPDDEVIGALWVRAEASATTDRPGGTA